MPIAAATDSLKASVAAALNRTSFSGEALRHANFPLQVFPSGSQLGLRRMRGTEIDTIPPPMLFCFRFKFDINDYLPRRARRAGEESRGHHQVREVPSIDREAAARGFIDDSGRVAVQRIADSFGMSKGQLAETVETSTLFSSPLTPAGSHSLPQKVRF